MNSRIALSTLVFGLLSAHAAFAQEGTQDFPTPARSTLTRAAVQADLAQALASGELAQPGEAYGSFSVAATQAPRTRAEVRAEAVRALAGGQHLSRGERGG